MHFTSRRIFGKISRRRFLLILITVGFMVLTYLLLISSQIYVVDVKEATLKICNENSGKETQRLSAFLHPDRDTSIILPKEGFYAKEERRFIATFVLSSPSEPKARQAIRDTWGVLMKPIFVLGHSSHENDRPKIEREAEEFGDIILEDFNDTYDNLTLKTGFALKHFIRHNRNSSFFFKIDDDVLLNVENLLEKLKTVRRDVLIGQLSQKSRPVKDSKSKWFMPDCIYEDEFYPDYLQGAGYIIPGHFVERIFSEAQQMKFFRFEDIFWTGFVAGRNLHMELLDDTSMEYTFYPNQLVFKFPCLLSEYVAVHKASSNELIDGWKTLRVQKSCSSISKFISKMSKRWIKW